MGDPITTLMSEFGDWAEKGASALLMIFGGATFFYLSFEDSRVTGTALVVAIAGSALIMITGAVLRVWAIKISSDATVKVKTGAIGVAKDAIKGEEGKPSVPQGG